MALTALEQYIPLQAGQAAMLKTQNLISNLLGFVGYEVRDGHVVFTENITDPLGKNVNAVDMQLAVMDMDHYGEYDLLPINAEMGAQIVQMVVAALMQSPPPDNKVDSGSEENPNDR